MQEQSTYSSGILHIFSTTEDGVDGFTSVVRGDADSGFEVVNTKLISIRVKKVWVGVDGDSATVHLYADGTEIKSATLTANEAWTCTFNGLDVVNSEGEEIEYSVTEDAVSGYTSEITGNADIGFIVTNTINPTGTLKLTARKTVDNEKPDKSYTFCLLDASGNILQTKQNDSDGNIQFDAIDYDASDIGQEYTYQVKDQEGSDDDITYDSSVYTVKVTPYQDPDDASAIVADFVIMKDGTEVSAITFNNATKTEEDSAADNSQNSAGNDSDASVETVDTGDGSSPVFGGVLLISEAVILGIAVRKRIRE